MQAFGANKGEYLIETRSAQEIWEAALGELQIQVNKSNYHTWLQKTIALDFQDNLFVIGVPNSFVAEYLDKNQRALIQKVLAGLLHEEIQVQFKVDTAAQNPVLPSRREKAISPNQMSLPLFNPKYTFDSFVKGNCNNLAFAAARKVAENPGQSYNPLFIYGGSGLGKTHLLQAIGQAALENKNNVLYVSAEHYTNDLMTAIRERNTDNFCNKYRTVDVLLVDDVQFFGGKEQTGENFFHTFDELYNANHQIAITCDCPPKSISTLPDRLRSRFEWGLATEIQPPDFATRLAILQEKTKQQSVNITTDVLELIAAQVQQNIRALEGSLNRVIAYARLVGAEPTPESATQALRDIASSVHKSLPVTPNLIIQTVANSFQLTPDELIGKVRDKETILARRIAMHLIREETNCTLSQIGRELGGRDAAAITKGCQRIASDIDASPYLKRKISDIQQKLHHNQE
jgi:chromosomal replication initiator protein